MEEKTSRLVPFLSPNRVEALTDGIFAVAMTLLVLALDGPRLPRNSTNAELVAAIRALAVPVLKYATSFLLLGTFWVIHIRQAQHIRRVDVPYIWLGMGALLLITLVPFSTSFMADFPDRSPAEYFFHFNILGISTFYSLQWIHATRNRGLVDPDLPEATIARSRRLGLLIPALAVLGLLLASKGPFESTLVYVFAPLLAALLRRFS